MIKGFHHLEHWQQNSNYWVVCGGGTYFGNFGDIYEITFENFVKMS
jgi:hypothetical protein